MINKDILKTFKKYELNNNLNYYNSLLLHIDLLFNLASNNYLFKVSLQYTLKANIEMIYHKIEGAVLYAHLCNLITQEQYEYIYSKITSILYYI